MSVEADQVTGPDRIRFYRREIGLQYGLASNQLYALISSESLWRGFRAAYLVAALRSRVAR